MVETPTFGVRDSMIATSLWRMLDVHSEARSLGVAFQTGLGYILRRDPDTVRIADATLVRRERLPQDGPSDSFPEFPPDIAVELVTPDLSAPDLRRKIRDYLDAGVRQVWIVWPDDQSVTVYTPGNDPHELGTDDMLDGGEVLPGFQVKVAELFEIEW